MGHVDVTCPEGVGPGELLTVVRPEDGASFDVEVPAGVEPGMPFKADLPDQGLVSSISAAQVEETPPQAQDLLALAVEAQRLTSGVTARRLTPLLRRCSGAPAAATVTSVRESLSPNRGTGTVSYPVPPSASMYEA